MSKVVESFCDKREDASVTTCWERWVLMGSVSLRPLGIRL